MRKTLSLILLILFPLLSYGQTIFSYNVPDFVLNNKFLTTNFSKYINLLVEKNDSKLLVLKGYYSIDRDEIKTITNKPINKTSRIWLSKLIFVDNLNNPIKEKTYKCFVLADLIKGKNNIYAVTKTKLANTEFLNYEIDFYNSKGELLNTIPLEHSDWHICPSQSNEDFIVLKNESIGDLLEVKIIPKNLIFEKKASKANKAIYKFKFENVNIPNQFCLIGGNEVSAIVSSGGTVKKISLKNKGVVLWKIDYLGGNVSSIKKLGKDVIGIFTRNNYHIVDNLTGNILKSVTISKIKKNLISSKISDNKKVYFKPEKTKIKENELTLAFGVAGSKKEILIHEKDFSENKTDLEKSKISILNFPEKKNSAFVLTENKIYKLTLDNDTLKIIVLPATQVTKKVTL